MTTKVDPALQGASHLEMVGIIASNWAELEMIIDATIWVTAKVNPNLGMCITGGLQSIQSKLTALYHLADKRNAPKSIIGRIERFQRGIHETAEKRNRAVHDPWIAIRNEGRLKVYQVGTYRKRGIPNPGAHPISIEHLHNVRQEIARQVDTFQKIRADLWNTLNASQDTPLGKLS